MDTQQNHVSTSQQPLTALPKPVAYRFGTSGTWEFSTSHTDAVKQRNAFEASVADDLDMVHEEPEPLFTAAQLRQAQQEAVATLTAKLQEAELDASRHRYVRLTTTAVRDPETGERIEVTPVIYDAAVDRARQSDPNGAVGIKPHHIRTVQKHDVVAVTDLVKRVQAEMDVVSAAASTGLQMDAREREYLRGSVFGLQITLNVLKEYQSTDAVQ